MLICRRIRVGPAHVGACGSGESYLEYGDSMQEKAKLRSSYLDTLDQIFSARRAAGNRAD
jgi:hypothetical protein